MEQFWMELSLMISYGGFKQGFEVDIWQLDIMVILRKIELVKGPFKVAKTLTIVPYATNFSFTNDSRFM